MPSHHSSLWDSVSGRFDGVRLHLEIVRRGLTVPQFAATVNCGRSSLYKAIRGHGVRDCTAIAILNGLEKLPVLLSGIV
jgi:predicted transcriptional regulator